MGTGITAAGVLGVLTKARLCEFGRALRLEPPDDKLEAAEAARALAAKVSLDSLLPSLTRYELRAACRAHALNHAIRACRRGSDAVREDADRDELITRV